MVQRLLHSKALIEQVGGESKFGKATNVDNGVATDIWDRANATDLQALWVAPTQARIHNIKSTSVNDTLAGTGAQTLLVLGIQAWSDPGESFEVVNMNGTTDVPTVNAWVVIHRLIVLTWGTAGPNVGIITATAVDDGTITAQIGAGNGQTLMAIYAVSAQQTIFVPGFYGSVSTSNAALSAVDMTLLAWDANNSTEAYVVKGTIGLERGKPLYLPFDPEKEIAGPCVVKLQGAGTMDNLVVDAGFGGELIASDSAA